MDLTLVELIAYLGTDPADVEEMLLHESAWEDLETMTLDGVAYRVDFRL